MKEGKKWNNGGNDVRMATLSSAFVSSFEKLSLLFAVSVRTFVFQLLI